MVSKVKISVLAKMLCMSVDAIRFYEKKGIVKPAYNEENGYREFSGNEVRILNDCSNLTAVGFSLNSVQHIIHAMPKEQFLGRLDEQCSRIESQIKSLQDSLDKLSYMKDGYLLPESDMNQFALIKGEELAFFCNGTSSQINEALVTDPVWRAAIEHRNLFTCTVYMPLEDLAKPGGEYEFGLSIPVSTAKARGFTLNDRIRIIPSSSIMRTIIYANPYIKSDHVNAALAEIRAMGYTLSGSPYAVVRDICYDRGIEIRKYELRFPVQSK